jgi:hypothetical protein
VGVPGGKMGRALVQAFFRQWGWHLILLPIPRLLVMAIMCAESLSWVWSQLLQAREPLLLQMVWDLLPLFTIRTLYLLILWGPSTWQTLETSAFGWFQPQALFQHSLEVVLLAATMVLAQ